MGKGGDIETGITNGAFYPNMMESPMLRWGFIRKVYTIVSIQLLITSFVASIFMFAPPIRQFFATRTLAVLLVYILIMILPLITMIPMICFRDKHPWNMVLLGLFTICISLTVGVVCATKSGKMILLAAVLTGVVVFGLTLYTFWAAKRGHDFSFLGPFLFAATLVLMIYSLMQILLPMGSVGSTIYGCFAALVFSGFIVYDTDNLIKRHSYDEYVMAAIALYLDIINLFMAILTILTSGDS